MARAQQKFDVHQEITNRIVAALETAGEFQLPWIRNKGGSVKRPVNIASAKAYNGVNIVSLWVSAQASDYPSNLWGTYLQWQERGCQVRRGEKSSLVVVYKKLEFVETNEKTGESVNAERLMARASFVFNAAQIDGFNTASTEPLPDEPTFDPIARAEAFARATGAKIEEGGDRACYIPSLDIIRMPARKRFTGTETTTPAEGYYSTLCHELVHYSGAKHRLDRDLTGRFGTESYAVEELVAELGAAFLCGDLGITPEPRVDHAQYIASWLKTLKDDKKAVFTAASKASEAANWLLAQGG
ncbi:ArdC family protein [Mesorhizobium australicum]|uniref:Antirestriction protein ArdC n=1 Tax=Mesorhizobium australicum TaxID=536018 RepID=A0A1X7NR05_9HYPH|nr:zincin-like metallopeptidase domain-containing protein [Mesorhizobium australicum]SMH40482.1 Antirestriction protein ArdC [Mesorhizobium australicum]